MFSGAFRLRTASPGRTSALVKWPWAACLGWPAQSGSPGPSWVGAACAGRTVSPAEHSVNGFARRSISCSIARSELQKMPPCRVWRSWFRKSVIVVKTQRYRLLRAPLGVAPVFRELLCTGAGPPPRPRERAGGPGQGRQVGEPPARASQHSWSWGESYTGLCTAGGCSGALPVPGSGQPASDKLGQKR